jgi:hypothetical protein
MYRGMRGDASFGGARALPLRASGRAVHHAVAMGAMEPVQ